MQSSEPLFTRKNPFTPSSRPGRAHYHPSRTHSLSKTEKKTALSPVRLEQAPRSPLSTRHQESQKLHESQKSCSGVTDEQPVFTESWPASTDCESSPTSCTALDNMDSMAHKIPSEGEADDTEILDLQERANRLLLREECITDGSIHASLEGLGCSDFSSTASNDEPQRRPFIPGIKISEDKRKARSDSEPAASSQKSFIPPSLVNPQRPEEDILFQWRLRRKMEQAREGPWHMQHTRLHGPTVSWQTPALNHPPATGPLFKPQPVAGVPSHMHFLCDVLPCPIQSSHTGRKQMISQDVCMSRCTPKAPENNLPDEPVHEPTPLSKPTSSEAKRGGATSHPQRPERKKKEKVSKKDTERVITTRKQKKSSVDTGDTEVPDSKTESVSRERVAQHLEQKRQKVVSEVLFPSVVSSSPAHRPPVSNGPVLPSSAASQPSDPPCDTHNSMEVIAQLLQEAEDSDGKEFEDDPLLQVLRKQRMWIREQIR
ncbi:hypothetical protein D4764_10G0004080 [Takifugu flavidus]|uniref:Proline and serine-rich protein 3 n=1 Tax=Takifugu flavidus TaxID=433684 RepID=A0A5C6PKX3_9TELE|nr:hypothetical protein D4764_10G0004080 [Takifugu flavidus]